MASTELTGGSDRQVLAELPLLGLLTPDVRELVVASFGPVRYEFGETIVAAGEPSDAFYVLRSGVARVLVVGDDGEEVSLNVLRAGDSFGEGGLLEGSPRTATVRAAGDVEALRLDVTDDAQIAAVQNATSQSVEQIGAVAKAVTHMASVASAIATSVVQQSAAANQISEAVQAAASNTKRATEDVQAVEHSTSDSLAVVRDIFTLTERLSSAAADLDGRVGEFFSRVRAA